jgi:hypothetical protein
MPIQVICAWCKVDMGTKEGEAEDVSHGICPDCYKKVCADEGLDANQQLTEELL